MAGRRSASDARDTRDAILRRAADLASCDGLDGVTIGRLAAEMNMSKAGVIGQFGSKEELQLATVEVAVDIFRRAVWEPVKHIPPGLPRLLALCRSWTDYAREPAFSGGCFIATVSHEFDTREGRVHDALAASTRRWRAVLVADIEQAVRDGDLAADTDAEQVAFALEALAAGAGPARRLQGDARAAEWSLAAMHAVIGVPAPAAAPA